ncbi:TetR/AcrR family transcriptional regulator [Pseudomonas chlororaphis]|uniref:TetR/AcrR family transcriptional regulator n=1 Tax=Pseudomonas chlororaphis TaxID=587753 RepID=UPI001E60CE17|nr:TetR/AcrR family transcriptional regulator [Pseudomonas chlororaphis]MCB2256212.1 TetR/AcrR family transcriptional regulator [Pseudomonas chlororaphis]
MAERCSNFAESRDKALELFASKGFGQVGMRELASHLGLAPGSLYHHYPSKQHLLLDLIEEFYDELCCTLKRLQKRKLQGDCLPALIHAHLKLHRELPRHFRLVERDSGCLNPDQQARVGHLREGYERQLLHLLGGAPGLGEAACRALAHAVACLLNSAPSWFSEQSLGERERDRLLENLLSGAIERLLAGAAPRSAVA